jgi:hypothetical protein
MKQDELVGLDKLLLRMEKNAKAWTYTRWLSVVFGLLFLVGGAWLLMKLPDAQRAGIPKDFSAPVDAFGLMVARQSAIDFCMLWALGLFQVAFGVNLLTSILCRWRKGHHDRLLVKMARAWLESQKPIPPSAL